MTNDNDTRISVGPLVQVVLGDSGEHIFAFSEMELDADPATISDRDLLAAVARHIDRPESDLAKLMVTRPSTGNLLVSKPPVFGSDEALMGNFDVEQLDEPLDTDQMALEDIGSDISEAMSAHGSDATNLALISIAKSLAVVAEKMVNLERVAERARVEAKAFEKAWKERSKKR